MPRTLNATRSQSAKLAVDAQVEEREFAHSVLHLKTNPKCSDVRELEQCYLADDPRATSGR
jgi:hypothetical protein